MQQPSLGELQNWAIILCVFVTMSNFIHITHDHLMNYIKKYLV